MSERDPANSGNGDLSRFECFCCGDVFARRVFTLTRSTQVHSYDTGSVVVEVEDAYTVATYCSSACQDEHIVDAMASEAVPLPAHMPGPGPIETCAVCQGLVIMTAKHRNYAGTEEVEKAPLVLQVVRDRTLAVVCESCSGLESAALALQRDPRRSLTNRH